MPLHHSRTKGGEMPTPKTRRHSLKHIPTAAAAAGLPLAACFAAAAIPQKPPAAAQPSKVQFNRDIRPILSDNCFACHGPDKNKRQANLRLDDRSGALASRAVVPGRPQESTLIQRIFSDAPQLRMPPNSSHKTLSDAQKSLLKRWIVEGAPYQPHWAYIVPKRPPVPNAAKQYTVHNPVDNFIAAKLMEKNILPSPQADRRTLLRRVSLDLTGLPPTPRQVQAFLNDTSPNAYEKVVDRLLASPAYGERMATPWLDYVRYADTVGYHGDQNMNAWPYRDYVIDSFNRNKPFDQFTREQIAGDLLPNPTDETRIATCFNRLNMVTREGGAQPGEYMAKYAADRVRTVGLAFLGSTFACAECHDHKYDPIKTRDFYAMAAFFADVKQWGVYSDYGYTPNPDLRGFTNDHPFPPEIIVESRYLKQRIATLLSRTAQAASSAVKARPAEYAQWHRTLSEFLTANPTGWQSPEIKIRKAAGGTAVANANSITVSDKKADTLEMEITPKLPTLCALRIDISSEQTNPGASRGRTRDGSLITAALRVERNGKTENIPLRYAGANYWEPRYVNGFDLVGVHRGWRLSPAHADKTHTAFWLPAAPVPLNGEDRLVLVTNNLPVGTSHISCSMLTPESAVSADFPTEALRQMSDPQSPAALRQFALSGRDPGLLAAALKSESEMWKYRDGRTPVMVTESRAPTLVRVLPRGNWQDESGQVVTPATPLFLGGPASSETHRLTRLDLAAWLTSPQNPLTARVFVNRLWKQFFGTGLSASIEDVGAQGEPPSHPELLDWLAVEFREKGWNIKHMVKLMVTSAAYRQKCGPRPELREIDPNNRLLAAQNPRRLEAEFVRDNALAVAGILVEEIGGPPRMPYQPPNYYENLQFPDRDWYPEKTDQAYRRGIYTHWQRTFLHPMLANFDAPSREECTANRTTANTPQQALTLLNDPVFVEAARGFAATLWKLEPGTGSASDTKRIQTAFQRALARPPRANELASLKSFLTLMRKAYAERPEDAAGLQKVGQLPPPQGVEPVEAAAWTSLCRVVLNLQETITRY
jgi:mono/diheme cytochrome c family protein